MAALKLDDRDLIGIRADNPGPFTLTGTNTWIIGREPAWLIDPGPAISGHVTALEQELGRRGGLGGIALSHDHLDHSGALPAMRERHPDVPVAAARGEADRRLGDGARFGPLQAMALVGHAPDHLVFLLNGTRDERGGAGQKGDLIAFTGDAVLGQGSVFIAPDPGALAAYLAGLRRLRELCPVALCPGHGPVVEDPQTKLTEYIEHRLDRERRLVEALAEGRRTVDELLDGVWSDAPEQLRPAAAVTLAAHLDKLEEEGRLPAGVERPRGWPPTGDP